LVQQTCDTLKINVVILCLRKWKLYTVLIDKLNYLNDNLDFNSLKINDLDFKLLKNYAFELSQLLNGVSKEESETAHNQVVREQLFHNVPKPVNEPANEMPVKIIKEPVDKEPIDLVEAETVEVPENLKTNTIAIKKEPEATSLNKELDKNVTENIFDTVKAIKKQHHIDDVDEPDLVDKQSFQIKNKPIEEAKELVPEKKTEAKSFDFMPSQIKEEKVKEPVNEEVETEEEVHEPSLNDRFKKEEESLAATIKVRTNRNFKELIDINDRFLFIQSLFGGSYLAFEEAIKQINKIESYSEALDYVDYKLKGTYDWSADSTEVTKFLNILERSYS